jgi:hypothetical protein
MCMTGVAWKSARTYAFVELCMASPILLSTSFSGSAMPTLDHIASYRIQPDPESPKLSRPIVGVDQEGQPISSHVIEERPLTIYLNAQKSSRP